MTSNPSSSNVDEKPIVPRQAGSDGPCRLLLLSTETAWCTEFKSLTKQLGFRIKRLDNPIDALVYIHEFDPHLFLVNEYRSDDISLEELCYAVRIPRQLRPLALMVTTQVPIPAGDDPAELGVDEIFDTTVDVDRFSSTLIQLFRLTISQRRVLDRERDILDSMPDALMIVGPDLRLWKVNRAFAELWGLNNPDPLRRHLGQPLLAALEAGLAYPAGREAPGRALCESLGLAIRNNETRFECREPVGPRREERYFTGQITRIESQGGQVLVALRDVTDREQSLRREARRERLATIGNLSVGVAHEIQNPNTFSRVNAANLKMLMGALKPLLDDVMAREPHRRAGVMSIPDVLSRIDTAISGIDMASHRIATVLETLKSFGRNSEESIGSTDAQAAIDEAVLLTKHAVRNGATLELDLPESLPPVRAAITELSQVFVNLIENAVKAFEMAGPQARGDGPGLISIHLENMTPDEVVFSVTDNGPGIDEALQKRIFRPYFTTRAQGEGTGLGLSLSSDILHRFDGDLTVRSRRGEGASFLVTLKRADSDVMPIRPS